MKSGDLSVAEEELLRLCARIELKAQELYDLLSQIHGTNPRISALWRKTSIEEGNHALQFRLSRRAGSDAMVEKVLVDPRRAKAAFKGVESVIERFKQEPPTVENALKTTIQLEEAFVVFHMEQAVAFTSEYHQKMFHALMAADNKHVESLKEALREITGGPVSVPA